MNSADRLDAYLDRISDDADAASEAWTDTPGGASLRVDWQDFHEFDDELADKWVDSPRSTAKLWSRRLRNRYQNPETDDLEKPISKMPVRPVNLPDRACFRLGGLRERHLGTLVEVPVEVVEVESVDPWLRKAVWECLECGALNPTRQGYGHIRFGTCMSCETSLDKKNAKLMGDGTEMVDFQKLVAIPRDSALDDPPAIQVFLTGDIVGKVGVGDEITVVGKYRTLPMAMQRETQLNTFIDAKALDVDERQQAGALSEDELDDAIIRAVDDLWSEDGTAYGVPTDDAISAVVDQHGVRFAEVENRIEALEDDGEFTLAAGAIIKD
ncbi:minichromosome maintenance protein MCM [Haloferax sulfurifontis]|uniref:Cdc46/Mcm family-like ATPase n=2 Tax=Haloferax sulfurifontis TaxID=255616 RepID=M0IL55_9EURY|nr:minichromosome maintenance protein MCM [Haloferax sulfurifontis]ELZ96578.1 Cdc46/Mcm family-like ATPase [Haloferax sulfurifontis ATCC BAA-897]GGC72715.1 hypothetical protein GCM10007209_38360 [Haloferax sulfurifontis]